jgi:hypothetical protein
MEDARMIYVSNAFSLNMLGENFGYVRIIEVDQDRLKMCIRNNHSTIVRSIVGHQDTANILSDVLGMPILFNRESVILKPGDTLLVAQYSGPRLPEGCMELPEGACFRWFMILI